MKLLEGKVAIITGAGSGIGEATAKLFAENGAKVVVSDINVENGEKVAKSIKDEGGEAIFVKCDTSDPDQHQTLISKTKEAFGGLHIAVNNAGIGGESAPVGEYDVKDWQRVININLNGVFYGMRFQLPLIEESGGGSIVNIASILGDVGFANSAAYVASKHGVVGLTKTAALDYGERKVRVNSVGPGFVYTGLVNDETMGDFIPELEKNHALGRLGESKEIAEMCLWLASDKSSFVTGAYFPVDGGYLAQ
ncbi:MAG: SDR family NAD(P)-dependent oxidoreductase [Weeksellaceae bacterium]|nr:SDR family NAD(P)-dependent oxidoreductase [Weeksellaceae bacterium]